MSLGYKCSNFEQD